MKKSDAPNGSKPKKETRLEKFVVFLLVVLISLLSFSVGVMSGKGLSDKEYALKAIDTKYSQALNMDPEDDKVEGDLSEEEIQQLANAAIQAAEKSGAMPNTTSSPVTGDLNAKSAIKADPKAVAKTDAKTDAKKETVANKVFDNKAPAAGTAKNIGATEDERIPSSVNKAAMSLEYTVQVAAYPSSKDAENMTASLIKKGYPAFPLRVLINGEPWYRVSVGSFKNKKEAMQYQGELKKQGVVKDSVVQKITK